MRTEHEFEIVFQKEQTQRFNLFEIVKHVNGNANDVDTFCGFGLVLLKYGVESYAARQVYFAFWLACEQILFKALFAVKEGIGGDEFGKTLGDGSVLHIDGLYS